MLKTGCDGGGDLLPQPVFSFETAEGVWYNELGKSIIVQIEESLDKQMEHKTIKGNNIILREQREEDAAFFAYWFNQPKIMFQCGFIGPTNEKEELKYINEYHKSEDSVWFTITDLRGTVIGETGLLRMFPSWHCTDLTIIIPDPDNQHKGYGTEAIRFMLNMAFTEYDMNRVSIGVVGLNTEALEFYKRIGFKQEGIQEQGYYCNGEYSDFIMMRILRKEWE